MCFTERLLFRSAEPTKGSVVSRIDSEVVSVSLYPMNVNSFEEPVTLTIQNTQVRLGFFICVIRQEQPAGIA